MEAIKILVAVALLNIVGVTALKAEVKSDKFAHAFVGVGIYGACLLTGGILDEMGYEHKLDTTYCLIPVAIAGIGKELYDSKHDNHTAEFADFAYTMAIPVGFSVVFYEW